MSAQVLQFPSLTCVCGLPGRWRDSIAGNGLQIIICDDCYDHRHAMMDLVRPVFEKMIECKIDEATANKAMTYLLELLDP